MTKFFLSKVIEFLLRIRNRHFLLLDVCFLIVTPFAGSILVVGSKPLFFELGTSLVVVTLFSLAIKISFLYRFDIYKRYWRYASVDEAAKLSAALVLGLVVQYAVFFVLRSVGFISPVFPASVLLVESLLAAVAVCSTRFSIRLAERIRQRVTAESDFLRVMVVGAGEAGLQVVSEMQRKSRLHMIPILFVDDDLLKIGARIRSISVEGICDEIPELALKHDIGHVLIAIPSAPGHVIRRIVRICQGADLETQIMPGISEILEGKVLVSQLRPVRIEDLLRRDSVVIEEAEVESALAESRIMVTGGAGSIGGELCRQILRYHPSELVVLDHSENAVFELEMELASLIDEDSDLMTVVHPVIADVRDVNRLSRVFELYRPQIVFHAAAHKHVPLMEAHVCESVINNVLGTRNVLSLAGQYGVERFVMISSDKAVNPSSIMGATKRVGELLVRDQALRFGSAFAAVRFGNVLGSRGSVVPLFQKQIAEGGPITITHPEIRRYFMSIPEAVQLVLQASAQATCGEIFVLDMGAPIRIVDLAEDLIRLSGLEVGSDIEIKYTGLRPGEKLFEELFLNDESYESTRHDKIFVSRPKPNIPENETLDDDVAQLIRAAEEGNKEEVIDQLREIIPECQFDSLQIAACA